MLTMTERPTDDSALVGRSHCAFCQHRHGDHCTLPGSPILYYGDEIARSLVIPGTKGDATLRSVFDWQKADTDAGRAMLQHWQKLGQFRKRHPAIGAGRHHELAFKPYTFARTLNEAALTDKVVVAMTAGTSGPITIRTGTVFPEGTLLRDSYGGEIARVLAGVVHIANPGRIVLLEAVE